jgi:hypothetical protein
MIDRIAPRIARGAGRGDRPTAAAAWIGLDRSESFKLKRPQASRTTSLLLPHLLGCNTQTFTL